MSLNRVILMGRITHTPEMKVTTNNTTFLQFTLAVERRYQKQGEEKQTDFISCVAWREKAEFINKYFDKGSLIAVEGSLQSRTYDDKNGTKHYVTEVVVDNVSFTGESRKDDTAPANPPSKPADYRNLSNEDKQVEEIERQQSSIGDLSDFEDIISGDGVPF